MREVEILQAENLARHHLDRIKTIEARMSSPRQNCRTDSGIVPNLCQVILALTAELKKSQKLVR